MGLKGLPLHVVDKTMVALNGYFISCRVVKVWFCLV